MKRTWVLAAFVLFASLSTTSCGSGSTTPVRASNAVVNLVLLPTGSTPPPGLPAIAPVSIELRGDDFSEILTADCLVRFRAVTGTPFLAGTSATVEVPGHVTPNGVVECVSPTMALCGEPTLESYVTVVLPSGFAIDSDQPIAQFLAPRLLPDLTPTAFPAANPTAVTMSTQYAGAVDGNPDVILHWSAEEAVFAGADTTTSMGTLQLDGSVTATTPVAGVCGPEGVVGTLERLEFPNGACTPPEDAIKVQYMAPRMTEARPRSLSVNAGAAFEITGSNFGAILGEVTIHWRSALAIFEDGTATETTSTGTVASTTSIDALTPGVDMGERGQAAAEIFRIDFPGGSCTPTGETPLPVVFQTAALNDVVEAFTGLHYFCERLSIWPPDGGWTDGLLRSGSKSHWQGMARVDYGGIPYFIMAAAGRANKDNDPLGATGGVDPSEPRWSGHVFFAEMKSRQRDVNSVWAGERMRSNRLARNDESIIKTAPPASDKVVYDLVEGKGVPTADILSHYRHPGGIQVAGDLLAVSWEGRNGVVSAALAPTGKIALYDLTSIFDPITGFKPGATLTKVHEIGFSSHAAGAVGLTRLKNGRYLMVVGAYDSGLGLKFLLSRNDDPSSWAATDNSGGTNPTSDFKVLDGSPVINAVAAGPVTSSDDYRTNWYEGPSETGTMKFGGAAAVHDDWPMEDFASFSTHQTFNLVTQRDGEVFLVCSRNELKSHTKPTDAGRDFIVVHRLLDHATGQPIATEDWDTADILMEAHVELHQQSAHPGDGGNIAKNNDTHGSYMGANGVYVTPTGQLVWYGVEHHKGANPADGDLVNIGEWRHLNPNRFQTPVTLETAWVELFASLNDGPRQEGDRMLLVDYVDWAANADDYDDFGTFEGNGLNEFHDDTSGVRWNLPRGTSAFLWEDDGLRGKYLELRGTGKVEEIRDLDKLEEVTRLRGDIVRGFESDGTRVKNNSNGELGFDFDGKASGISFGPST